MASLRQQIAYNMVVLQWLYSSPQIKVPVAFPLHAAFRFYGGKLNGSVLFITHRITYAVLRSEIC